MWARVGVPLRGFGLQRLLTLFRHFLTKVATCFDAMSAWRDAREQAAFLHHEFQLPKKSLTWCNPPTVTEANHLTRSPQCNLTNSLRSIDALLFTHSKPG